MTVLVLLSAAGVVAIGDWIAVQLRLYRIEYVLKPMTLALLVAAAAAAHLGTVKPEVVTALALGLVGDVGLMLSKQGRADRAFLAGLSAFLLGHGAYIITFVRVGVHGLDLVAGGLIVAGVAGLALPRVLRSVAASGRVLLVAVAAYSLALAAMTVLGVGTGIVVTAIGAALFLTSDTLLARQRFVAPVPNGDLLVIVTYHLAQFCILIGLIRSF